MTKRYFYTDPLAAAWMAKHFGIAFETPDGRSLTCKDGKLFFPMPHPGIEGAIIWVISEDEHYIHPDSLHLLEPKVGDLVQFIAYDDTTQPHLQGYRTWWKPYLGDWAIPRDASDTRIIQRDGKAYHWPEVEND